MLPSGFARDFPESSKVCFFQGINELLQYTNYKFANWLAKTTKSYEYYSMTNFE